MTGLLVFSGVGSITCVAADVFFHLPWWIVVPLFVVLVLAMVWCLTH